MPWASTQYAGKRAISPGVMFCGVLLEAVPHASANKKEHSSRRRRVVGMVFKLESKVQWGQR